MGSSPRQWWWMKGMTSQRMYSSNMRCIQLRWNGCAPLLYQLASLFEPTM
jgi:hypothetical protein